MSITYEVVVWCDLCGCWERSIHTTAKARKKLKDSGWTRVKATLAYTTVRDFCPNCSQYRKETK